MKTIDPPLSNKKIEQVYDLIVSERSLAYCDRKEAEQLIEDLAARLPPDQGRSLHEKFRNFLADGPSDHDVWKAVKGLAEMARSAGFDDLFIHHNARIIGSRLDDFADLVNAATEGKTVVFIAEHPYFVILREAMYLKRNGYRVFLVSLWPISKNLRHLFDEHFDAVLDTGGDAFLLAATLKRLDADILHVQCGMWGLYLGRLAIENKGRAVVVCEFYDITSVYAKRDLLLTNWSVAAVDFDFAMERYIAHHTDAVITRFTQKAISEWSARHGATPRHVTMQAYACPEFTAYGDGKLSKKDGVIRLVYGGTVIPVNENQPPELFPETGMPKALRSFLEQGLAVDILHNPHSPIREDDPAYAPFVALEMEFPNFRLLNGVPPDEFAQTLAVYDYGILLMDYDKSVVRIGEGQEKDSVSTKIFAYMEAGLPVLINAEYAEMARIVTESGLGLAVHSSELGVLAKTLARFDYETAVANVKRYNEEHGMAKEIHRLIALYDEIRG
ncbi:MAG TPA: hypothetical protein ENI69_00085 [Rhodospirillales bacterium]|nr:hypothetical protein [Rhodospirillales bacterium]